MAENQGGRGAGRTVCGASGVLSGSPGLTQRERGYRSVNFSSATFCLCDLGQITSSSVLQFLYLLSGCLQTLPISGLS